MATIVNNPATERERIVDSSDNGGWAVAVIVLLAVLVVGGFLWMRYYNAPAATQNTNPGVNLDVTLPANDNSGSTGGTGSTNTNTNTGGASAPAAQ
jgi:hypothetical protein